MSCACAAWSHEPERRAHLPWGGFAKLADGLSSWTALRRTPFGKRFVAARGVNADMVNRGAPELFPVMCLVKKWFTRREVEERRAFGPIGIACHNTDPKMN